MISSFLKDHKEDAFLHDLAGQIALETGNLKDATSHYKMAYQYSNKIPLIGASYAQALIATEEENNMKEAIQILKFALQKEKTLPKKGFRIFLLPMTV